MHILQTSSSFEPTWKKAQLHLPPLPALTLVPCEVFERACEITECFQKALEVKLAISPDVPRWPISSVGKCSPHARAGRDWVMTGRHPLRSVRGRLRSVWGARVSEGSGGFGSERNSIQLRSFRVTPPTLSSSLRPFFPRKSRPTRLNRRVGRCFARRKSWVV